MGKMKELFMKINYPDIEREHFIDAILAQEKNYSDYLELKKDPEINLINSKIEIANGTTTRIEVNQEELEPHREVEIA